jgi:hypothetical protein
VAENQAEEFARADDMRKFSHRFVFRRRSQTDYNPLRTVFEFGHDLPDGVLVIRAVYQHGVIYPLEPVPGNWISGQQVSVDEAVAADASTADQLDQWLWDMQNLTAAIADLSEWKQIEDTLAEADRHAKAGIASSGTRLIAS